ncbi:MAG: RluA family pseudouridine synthase [Lachnospiraceae bacterium]|jgi:23S rRNA pseudouridine955/2504/2580 synthase
MKEFRITGQTEGQRLNKVLQKLLPGAGTSFLYKMLRKKNITVNDRKADGAQVLKSGDVIRIWFSDETYLKFAAPAGNPSPSWAGDKNHEHADASDKSFRKPDILYEDDDLLFVNKPAGVLIQPDARTSACLISDVREYLRKSSQAGEDGIFRVGPANRLDRNTSGIAAFGKTIRGQQYLAEQFRERDMKKYYLALVKGRFARKSENEQILSGWYVKNHRTNKALVYRDQAPDGAAPVAIGVLPVTGNERETLLRVHLLTGKSHQIRVQLSEARHPIAGDPKYGDTNWNRELEKTYRLRRQFLHAWRLELKNLSGSDIIVTAPLPDDLTRLLKGEKLWEPGIPEDSEGPLSKS